MAYALLNHYGEPQQLRFLVIGKDGEVKVAEPFTPYWWACDPCNHSSRRFEVTFRADQEKPNEYPWYQIVLLDDDARAIKTKCDFYAKVIDAEQAVVDAKNALHRLVA